MRGKERVRKNTGSLVWIAAQRPLAEHDRMAEVLLDGLLRATDEAQAGTLAWGLGS